MLLVPPDKSSAKKKGAQSPDFRRLIQNELVRRTQKNPGYSLRAFARMLGIQSGFLSKLLRGQRRVTPATVRRIGAKLGLSLQEIEFFEQAHRLKVDTAAMDFHQIAHDHFQVISDWYHFAILELAEVKGFDPSPRWIAKTLGLSLAEAQAAVERLVRIGYISIDTKGHWTLLEAHTTTLGIDDTNAALQQMQKQILQMAIDSLENVSVDRRDQTTMTMAIDSSLLPTAKERVKKFRRELCAFLESGKNIDSVYQLTISLYPLTKDEL